MNYTPHSLVNSPTWQPVRRLGARLAIALLLLIALLPFASANGIPHTSAATPQAPASATPAVVPPPPWGEKTTPSVRVNAPRTTPALAANTLNPAAARLAGPEQGSFDPSTGYLYIANDVTVPYISVINTATGSAGTYPVLANTNDGASSVFVDTVRHLLYVSDYSGNQLIVYDISNGGFVYRNSISLQVPGHAFQAGPGIMDLDYTTNILYVPMFDFNNASPSDNGVVALSVVNAPVSYSLVNFYANFNTAAIARVNQVTHKVYVSDYGPASVHSGPSKVGVIDSNGVHFITSTANNEFQHALGIAVNPQTNRIYVAEVFDPYGAVTVIDGNTDTIITDIRGAAPISPGGPTGNPGPGTEFVEVNPYTNAVYVGLNNTVPGTVYQIDGATNSIVSSVVTSTGTRGLVLIPQDSAQTTTLYTMNYNSGNISVVNDTPLNNLSATWYFAEGYTGPGFSEYLTVFNPSNFAVNVTTNYYEDTGATLQYVRPVAANSRATYNVNVDLGGAAHGVSAQVSTNSGSTLGPPIMVERPMYFTYKGSIPGAHNTPGANTVGTKFYFAEGYTGPGFDEYLTILNPNPVAEAVTITYYLTNAGVITKSLTIAPNSRFTEFVNNDVPIGSGVSAQVNCTSCSGGAGILAERPMYFNYNNPGKLSGISGGHLVIGTSTPATQWAFSQGSTTANASDEYLTILNPQSSTTIVTAYFYLETGGLPTGRQYTIPPLSRYTVYVNDPSLGVGPNHSVAAVVTGTQPIVVERPMYFIYTTPSGGSISSAYDTLGVTSSAHAQAFAEGYTGANFYETLVLFNGSSTVAHVQLDYFANTGGANTIYQQYPQPNPPSPLRPPAPLLTLAPGQIYTVKVYPGGGTPVPANAAVSVVVTSDQPIVVERPMYMIYNSISGAHDSIGVTLPCC